MSNTTYTPFVTMRCAWCSSWFTGHPAWAAASIADHVRQHGKTWDDYYQATTASGPLFERLAPARPKRVVSV